MMHCTASFSRPIQFLKILQQNKKNSDSEFWEHYHCITFASNKASSDIHSTNKFSGCQKRKEIKRTRDIQLTRLTSSATKYILSVGQTKPLRFSPSLHLLFSLFGAGGEWEVQKQYQRSEACFIHHFSLQFLRLGRN